MRAGICGRGTERIEQFQPALLASVLAGNLGLHHFGEAERTYAPEVGDEIHGPVEALQE